MFGRTVTDDEKKAFASVHELAKKTYEKESGRKSRNSRRRKNKDEL